MLASYYRRHLVEIMRNKNGMGGATNRLHTRHAF